LPSAFIQQALHSYAAREFWGIKESDDRQPRIAFEVNGRGTYNLLEACRNSPDPIEKAIVASSDKACGGDTKRQFRILLVTLKTYWTKNHGFLVFRGL